MEEYKVKKLNSKNGLEIIEVNGYQLHSKYDPLKEANAFFEKESKENYLHILFGYGAGYIAEEFKKNLPPEDIILVEPIKNIFDNLDKENEIVFSENVDEIKAKISKGLHNKKREITVICSPNYDKFASAQYKELLEIVSVSQKLNIIDENTLEFFSYDWQENYVKNMISVIDDNSLSVLEKQYTCPVIVASSGPSLDKQLKKLKSIQENVVIICAGSTINSLLYEKINPDYIVTIDGSELNYGHFRDVDTNSTLMYALTSRYNIQNEYSGRRMSFLTSGDELYQHFILDKFKKDLPLIEGGGSVAHFALTIAKYISSGPIAFIGQDLAYTNNVSHSSANKYKKNIEQVGKREFIEVEGYYGDLVKTDYAFLSMIENFETLMKSTTHTSEIYNCTEGGAKISNMNQLSFDKFIEKFVSGNKQLEGEINLIDTDYSQKLYEIYDEFIKKMISLKHEINKVILLFKGIKRKEIFLQKDLKQLDKIDKKIKNTCEEVLLSHITYPLMKGILSQYKETKEETELERFDRVYNQNLALYSGMLEVIVAVIDYHKEAQEILKRKMGA